MSNFEYRSTPVQGRKEAVEARRANSEVAVIGVGEWARRALLPTLFRLGRSGGFERFHLVDANHEPDPPRESGGLLFTVSRGERAVNEILARDEVTHVVVSAPDLTHYNLAMCALDRGKHVFVEKTLVASSAQVCALVRLAEMRRRVLMVGYQFMYDPRFAAIKQLVRSGELGEILEMDVCLFNRPSELRNGTQGTTVVENHLVHPLSILQLMLGNAVIGDLQVIEAGETRVGVCFAYRGARIVLATRLDYPGRENYRRFRLRGSRMTIELDFQSITPEFRVEEGNTYALIKPDDRRYPPALGEVQQHVSSVESELRTFFTCAVEGRTPVSGGENAVHLTHLMECINNVYIEACVRESRRAKCWQIALRTEIKLLGSEHRWTEEPAMTNHLKEASGREQMTRVVEEVAACLREKPYVPAEALARKLSLAPEKIAIAYRIIQHSHRLQFYLREGPNYDYFEVVDAFLNRRAFEATFFVGLWCPYRCSFCKRQMSSRPVHRSAGRFDLRQSDLMSDTVIERTLDELSSIRDGGRNIIVKISGGLEPFSDAFRVGALVRSAKARGLAVKLYSNGALIDTEEKRRIALAADELRVSLNSVNDSAFRATHLPHFSGGHGAVTLEKIWDVLGRLVGDRRSIGARTRIGLNFVVTRTAASYMVPMARFAARAGLDYINFNIDYEDAPEQSAYTLIEEQTAKLKFMKKRGELSELLLSFGGSLQQANLFSSPPEGAFDPSGICCYKVFIDPCGNVTPVHEGTFAFVDLEGTRRQNPFVLGRLGGAATLTGILDHRHPLPDIGFKYLAPLELILGLETLREEADERIGISRNCSPYRKPHADLNTQRPAPISNIFSLS